MTRRSWWGLGVIVTIACAAPEVVPPQFKTGPAQAPPIAAEALMPPAEGVVAAEIEGAIAASAGRSSDAPLALSVEEATLLALQNNRDLRVQSFGPVVAGTFARIEQGVFDPELFLDAQYRRERASQTARATGERFDVEGSSTDVSLGIRQRFSTGTDVEAVFGHQLDESDLTPTLQQARVGLTVTQALLRGLGPAVNLAAVRQAELEAEASEYQLTAFTQSLVADTETAYWTYALAEQEIAIFERSLEVARKEASDIEDRIDVGLLPELEVAAAKAEVARREQALIDANSRLEEARLRLNRLVNSDPTGSLGVLFEVTSPPRPEPDEIPLTDVPSRLELADRYRPDLAEARLRRRQNRLQTVVTRNGVLPRLDFFVALGKSGFAEAFGASFDNLGEPTYDVTAGVSLSQFLGNRAAVGRDLAAHANLRQADAAVENLRQFAFFEVRLALNELDRARAQVNATATTRALQERAVVAEKERFEVGTGTALAVAQAQRDLLASQIDEVRAVVDYRRALIRLYEAEGTLLLRRGITVAR